MIRRLVHRKKFHYVGITARTTTCTTSSQKYQRHIVNKITSYRYRSSVSKGAIVESANNTSAEANVTTNTSSSRSSSTACPSVVAAAATSSYNSKLKTQLMENIQCYKELSKVRLTSLVVGSTVAGFLMAGAPESYCALTSTIVGTYLCAFSANTFNQVYEIKTDGLMKRTMGRPLPSGRMSTQHAAGFGLASGLAGTSILFAGANPLTAFLGLANIALYAGVYTPMKQTTKWNTWVGSLVGAIPPLMGWAAATGTLIAPEAGLLAATLFYWQFPHFFALAWMLRKDYKAGGYKMITDGDIYGKITSKTIRNYSLYLAIPPLLTSAAGYTSAMFAVETLILNGYCYYSATQFVKETSDKNAKKVFMNSLWYLPVVMTLMVYHSERWTDKFPELRTTMTDACPHENLIKDPLRANAALCPSIVVGGNKNVISVEDVLVSSNQGSITASTTTNNDSSSNNSSNSNSTSSY